MISWLYANGKVLNTDYDESAAIMEVELDKAAAGRVLEYIEEVGTAGGS
ncbi:MAG TPA: hypothetical protein PLO77_09060 [Thermoclostridium caenicola]|nr:hypothetical protein [Thermoclostridium caenicola]